MKETQRISLGTDVPDYLPGLLAQQNINIDHIKVGLWQGSDGARREAALLPGLPILLHGDNQAAGDKPLSRSGRVAGLTLSQICYNATRGGG